MIPRLSTQQRKQIASKRKRNSDGTFAGASSTVKRHARASGILGAGVGGIIGVSAASRVSSAGGLTTLNLTSPFANGGRTILAVGTRSAPALRAGLITGGVAGGLLGGMAAGAAGGLASHWVNKKTGNTLSNKQKIGAVAGSVAGTALGGIVGSAVGGAATTAGMAAYNEYKAYRKWKAAQKGRK